MFFSLDAIMKPYSTCNKLLFIKTNPLFGLSGVIHPTETS